MKKIVLFFILTIAVSGNYRILKEELPMDQTEFSCYMKCDRQNMSSLIFGKEQCFCGTPLDFLKKYYPKKYKQRKTDREKH